MGSAALAAPTAGSAYDLLFVDEAGSRRREPLPACWDRPFETAAPVRSFPSVKDGVNWPGYWWSATNGRHVGFESWVERDVAMMLDFDPAVTGFSSQPFWLYWPGEKGQRRHAPDFFARLADGGGVVVDVRPDDQIDETAAEAFAATARVCAEAGWEFRRTGGPAAVLAANVRWLAGYRHPRCFRAGVAQRLLGVFGRPAPLLSGARQAGDPIAVLPVLYHLLWRHDLHAGTAIKQLGRAHELLVRNRYPAADRIPVVYVTAPPKGSPKKLATQFAHFLGMPPFRSRANEMDIATAACEVLTEARTDLVIVDEIHNVNLATTAGEDLSDHLKYFTEHLPATFVFAGINVESGCLFTGVRGQQIAARCVMTRTGKFPYRDEWRSMVATMEQALRLHRHEPGSLVAQARYLHQRTGGLISSLSHIIRAAAISAIVEGSEQITRDLLDGIVVDHATESAAPKPPRPREAASERRGA